MKETVQQATKRILGSSEPGVRYPVKRYKPGLEIGIFRRFLGDGPVPPLAVSVDENLWGVTSMTSLIEYETLEGVMDDGWIID